MRTCEQCGRPLKPAATGRPPRFCNQVCRQRAHRAHANVPIAPTEMTSLRRWVRWRPVQRNGRWTKLPVQASGRAASSTDPQTWSEFYQVRAAGERIGFVLGAGIGCIDLDHCLIDGRPNEATRDLLAMLPATWIEVSPSGDGLHVWGRLSEGAGRVASFNGQSVEIYSAGRYITVTGNRWAGSHAVLADLSGAAALV